MSTTKQPKQVKVHADGCSPDSLELFTNKDTVVFIQSGPNAPATVHVDSKALFGTSTCTVGATSDVAKVYTPQAPGNYVIGLSAASTEQPGKGTVQVLCLGVSGALGVSDTGTIKVTR